MPEDNPIYLVNPENDPVMIKIKGRASYLNCAPVRKLVGTLLAEGRCRILVDFKECTGMDSTFLGLLAGAAIDIKKKFPAGYLKLCRLNDRNMELVCNLGLHRLMSCACESAEKLDQLSTQALPSVGQEASKQMILEAHERLIEADASNLTKFQDVVTFLKKQVEQE